MRSIGDAHLPHVVVLWGATAVGKTDLAIRLAQHFDGEIISADSRQIYRHMDIGTAKPTPAQQTAIRHHLLDVVTPDQTLSLAEYQQQALAAIADIHQRRKLPFVVGGTGQYITALVEGWSTPQVPPDPALRAELEALAAEHGASTLHQRLAQHDPAAAGNIDYRNVRRVVRALEVCLLTGQPFSAQTRKTPPPYRFTMLGLQLERETLYQRADQRLHQMIAQGFAAEVQHLLALGYSPNLPSMSGIGYQQLCAHLQDELPLAQAIELTQYATHDFIRRQLTWFRGHNLETLWHNSEQIAQIIGHIHHANDSQRG
jgi:tRNA dimethylallyltransferase